MALLSVLTVFHAAQAASTRSERQRTAVFDFGAPPKTNIQLAPDLFVGARAELEFDSENNFDLDHSRADDLHILDSTLSLALSYVPTDSIKLFLNVEPTQRWVIEDQRDRKDDETKLDLKQGFIEFDDLYDGLRVRVGRQRFKDSREWLYDEELDALRLSYAYSRFSVDLLAGENRHKDLVNDGEDDRVDNYLLYGRYAHDEDTEAAIYAIAQKDQTSADDDPVFFGLHLHGEAMDDLEYWLEMAHARGHVDSRKIRAYGLDLGATFELDHDLKPSITIGYAYGSGDDDPTDGTDRNFRQTGLQDNDAKFNGITRLKYYGEAFDPELSNLMVFTGGIGIKPTRRSSVELVYHYYRQDEAADEIREAEIDEDPDGIHKELGHEFDLVAGFRARRHFKATAVVGYFQPGKAYSSDDGALFGELKLRYQF